MKYLVIISILIAGSVKVNAQQLASQKPVETYYSKTTKRNLDTKSTVSKPAATTSRQELASGKAMPQPSVSARVQPKQRDARRLGLTGKQKLASEKPFDMVRITKQLSQKSRASR